jgi:hypothetical protein
VREKEAERQREVREMEKERATSKVAPRELASKDFILSSALREEISLSLEFVFFVVESLSR